MLQEENVRHISMKPHGPTVVQVLLEQDLRCHCSVTPAPLSPPEALTLVGSAPTDVMKLTGVKYWRVSRDGEEKQFRGLQKTYDAAHDEYIGRKERGEETDLRKAPSPVTKQQGTLWNYQEVKPSG
ncbi:hypothetical protein P7K49_011719 [Saguinus oedipus]|uniref:Uncharacterized protein n=1 Tax=Saguinus oedipus TaxID=9490 RepID=A0ABQ9VRS8_SAGOE|nr:hypothetical protein P7K49_011719 [Saguinus oedipus]